MDLKRLSLEAENISVTTPHYLSLFPVPCAVTGTPGPSIIAKSWGRKIKMCNLSYKLLLFYESSNTIIYYKSRICSADCV